MNKRTGALLRASGAAGCAARHRRRVLDPGAVGLPRCAPRALPASPAPPSSNSSSPSPSTAVAPKVVCDRSAPASAGTDDSGSPIPVTLTCENAVAAAEAVVGPDPAIAYIEFNYVRWCPPGYFCAMSTMERRSRHLPHEEACGRTSTLTSRRTRLAGSRRRARSPCFRHPRSPGARRRRAAAEAPPEGARPSRRPRAGPAPGRCRPGRAPSAGPRPPTPGRSGRTRGDRSGPGRRTATGSPSARGRA